MNYFAGVSRAECQELERRLDNRCSICTTSDPGIRVGLKTGEFSLDYDGVTGEVRGLLCSSCSQKFGLLGAGDHELLQRAQDYLKTFYEAHNG